MCVLVLEDCADEVFLWSAAAQAAFNASMAQADLSEVHFRTALRLVQQELGEFSFKLFAVRLCKKGVLEDAGMLGRWVQDGFAVPLPHLRRELLANIASRLAQKPEAIILPFKQAG